MQTTQTPPRLGNLLVERGYLTPECLTAALEQQRGSGQNKLLGELLIESEACSEEQVVECLAAEYGVPYARLGARIYDPKVIDILPRDYIEKNLVLPLFVIRETLTLAMAEPSNLFLIDEIHGLTHLEVQIVAATSKESSKIPTPPK
jgi:type IV pilus assembly protein PilB